MIYEQLASDKGDKSKAPLLSTETESESQVLTKPRVKRPAFYRVLLLNDDFTPMDFVVHILKKFFTKTDVEATQIMLEVHNQGAGLAGVFSYEVAETKVYQVNEYARRNQHPLKCVMEKDGGKQNPDEEA